MNSMHRFKLFGRGDAAIKVWGKKLSQVRENGPVIVDEISQFREGGLSLSLKALINELKYYYLTLTGHWIPPFSNHFDLSAHKVADPPEDGSEMTNPHKMLKILMEDTFIIGVSVQSNGFVITGMVETVARKYCIINTPFICESDDIGFFINAMEKIQEIFNEILKEINQLSLMDVERARRYLLVKNKDKESLRVQFDQMSDEEIIEKANGLIMDKGGVVLMPGKDEIPRPALRKENTAPINTNTANIDAANLPNAKASFDNDKDQQEETEEYTDNFDVPEQDDYVNQGLEPDENETEYQEDEDIDVPTPPGFDDIPVDQEGNIDPDNVVLDPEKIIHKPPTMDVASEKDFPDMDSIPAGTDKSEW